MYLGIYIYIYIVIIVSYDVCSYMCTLAIEQG